MNSYAIKICGLTTFDDACQALEAGADYLGFVLYPQSPRAVTLKALESIVCRLPGTAKKVGVFVNETPEQVKEVAALCGLAAVQLHGDEDPLAFQGMTVPVWRAVRLQEGLWKPDPWDWAPERFVMDAASPAYGGSGVKVDWAAAEKFAAQHWSLLAGGLDPDTVGAAIRAVCPAGVDVSSGVEAEPGRKDHAKVSAFIRAARAAFREFAF